MGSERKQVILRCDHCCAQAVSEAVDGKVNLEPFWGWLISSDGVQCPDCQRQPADNADSAGVIARRFQLRDSAWNTS